MRALTICLLLAGCHASEGERCNPLQFSDSGTQGNCEDGLACVYPTASNCGVAYCCKVDSSGNVIDRNPSCQPDPALAPGCGLDLSTSD